MAEKLQDQSAPQSDQVNQETLTIEQVNAQINAAISSRLKSFEKKFDEALSKLTTKPEQQEGAQKEEKVSNSELISLKKQFEALQKERDQEVSKRKDLDLRTSLKDQLQKAGVAPHMLKAATAILVDHDKLVGYNEEDQLSFRSDTGDLDLVSGVKQWLKSSEGKAFMSPKNISGSGEKSQSNSQALGNKVQQPTRREVAELLEIALTSGQDS